MNEQIGVMVGKGRVYQIATRIHRQSEGYTYYSTYRLEDGREFSEYEDRMRQWANRNDGYISSVKDAAGEYEDVHLAQEAPTGPSSADIANGKFGVDGVEQIFGG